MRNIVCMIAIVIMVSVCGCRKTPTQHANIDFYGVDYQACLTQARSQTAYTHETMREETMGKALDNCMADHGWNADRTDLY